MGSSFKKSSIATPLSPANGGTGNTFTKFSGPTTSEKTFILPDANTVLVGLDTEQTLENKIVKLNPAPSDNSYSGETCVFTTGETITAGQVCYLKSDGKMWLSKSDVMATSGACILGLAVEDIDIGNPGTFLMRGFYQNTTLFNFTPCVPEYISSSNAGSIVETPPSVETNIVRIIGYGRTADIIYFCPDNTYLEI